MAINFDYEFVSELTIILEPNDEKIIKFNGIPSISIISVHLMDITGSCIVKSAQESETYLTHKDTTINDILWEFIKINKVEIPVVTSNILSHSFRSPSVLYIKNVSTLGESIKINIRGNR